MSLMVIFTETKDLPLVYHHHNSPQIRRTSAHWTSTWHRPQHWYAQGTYMCQLIRWVN